jgi:AcrR family transcriptional regulator
MDTKEHILQTSFREFLRNGYEETSMSTLVKESGLSKGAFYHYFKNKEELYFEVIRTYFLSYYQQFNWEEFRKSSISSAEIEKLIQQFYRTFIPEILREGDSGLSGYFILFFEAYNRYPLFKESVRTFYQNLEKLIADSLEREGKARSLATDMIAKYEGMMFLMAVFPERGK